MKRLATLALAVILVTGCNAMKPNMEEAELLSKEIEKKIYAQALSIEAPEPVGAPAETKETAPAPAPIIVSEQEDELRPVPSEPAEEPQSAAPVPAEESEEIPFQQAEPAETIVWPYPAITCPPEPESAPEIELPYITTPKPPTYTPKPEPIDPSQVKPAPTPQPTPAVPVDPTPEPTEQPTEQPAEPAPDPTTEPQTGYAECSCGAILTPEEVLPHMKAHALNGESHSYRAY